MKRVLFAGGGTAGYVVPVLPLIRTLAREGVQMNFVGSSGSGVTFCVAWSQNRAISLERCVICEYIEVHTVKWAYLKMAE